MHCPSPLSHLGNRDFTSSFMCLLPLLHSPITRLCCWWWQCFTPSWHCDVLRKVQQETNKWCWVRVLTGVKMHIVNIPSLGAFLEEWIEGIKTWQYKVPHTPEVQWWPGQQADTGERGQGSQVRLERQDSWTTWRLYFHSEKGGKSLVDFKERGVGWLMHSKHSLAAAWGETGRKSRSRESETTPMS